jgi:hypothetical protein
VDEDRHLTKEGLHGLLRRLGLSCRPGLMAGTVGKSVRRHALVVELIHPLLILRCGLAELLVLAILGVLVGSHGNPPPCQSMEQPVLSLSVTRTPRAETSWPAPIRSDLHRLLPRQSPEWAMARWRSRRSVSFWSRRPISTCRSAISRSTRVASPGSADGPPTGNSLTLSSVPSG